MKRKLLIGSVLVIGVFVAVILIRAWLHQPNDSEPISRVTIDIDDMVAARHLSEAIQFRTVSNENSGDFNSEQFTGFIDWIARTYPAVQEAMDLELIGDYTLLYRWQGIDDRLKPILLTGHYDVVPVSPSSEDQWFHPPYEGAIDDDYVWGRGTQDDKSAVVAQLEAATYLLNSGFKPSSTFYFSFGHDEENGGDAGAARVAEFLKQADVQLEWSLDEGSFLMDGLFPGVDPLVAAINVAEKGSVTLQIVANSAGGHSSMPPTQTAVGRLATAITRLESNPLPGGLTGLSKQVFENASRHMPFGYKILFANTWLFGGLIDRQLSTLTFGNAVLRTTIAPTMLSASEKTNVLPTEAVATVNFRIHPRDSLEDVVNHVKSVVESDHIEVRLGEGSGRPASVVSDWNSVGFEVIRRSVREVYGDVVVSPGLMIAGSDTRHYAKVADNSFRFNPMVQNQSDLDGFHGTNEKISVTNLGQGVRAYIQIIRNATSN